MGGVNFQSPRKKWRQRITAREVLVLATEDDCSGRSNSENRESIDRAIHTYLGKTWFSTEGLEDVRAIMG